MKTRTLGGGLEVSALGLGCMGLDFGYAAKVTKAEGSPAPQCARAFWRPIESRGIPKNRLS